jgi:hypothetical protein
MELKLGIFLSVGIAGIIGELGDMRAPSADSWNFWAPSFNEVKAVDASLPP